MEENIETFTGITGATPEVARRYLGLTENDAGQAIQLYFDSPDLASAVDHVPQDSAPPVPTSTRPQTGVQGHRRGDSAGSHDEDLMDVDDDEDSDGGRWPTPGVGRVAEIEDDEAMARRMQEEMYAGGADSGGYDADGVRAPIGRRTETLVGGSEADWTQDDMQAAVLQQMSSRAQARPSRLGVFNQEPVSSIWEENGDPDARRQGLARATGGASESSNKHARLAELFRPPFELMQQVPWDVARDKGKEEVKWILVNVQDPSFFDCQSLNRDIWKHDGIKELVKENFIFIQYSKDDPRGAQYVQYYFPLKDSDSAYPHIAIVDPRTGEQVKVWSGPPVPPAGEFLMQLVEFLDRYSLDVTKKNPVAKRKPEKSKSIDVERLTEEEMLDLALKNSLVNNISPGPKSDDPDDLTKSFRDSKGKGKEISEEEDDAEGAHGGGDVPTDSPFSRISSTNAHTEPAAGPRVQFRHPNGRVVRRFNETDTVRSIYEWLKAEPLEGKEGIAFELKEGGGMGKETRDLIDYLDVTVKEAGLGGGTIMVEFLEE